jgi:leucyl-tRNA synthetase
MTLLNEFQDKGASKGDMSIFLQLLNPFAPHITEELWEMLGFKGILSVAEWPAYDENKTKDARITFAVQVNGKLRSTVELDADSSDEVIIDAAKNDEKIRKFIEGMQVVKTILVKGKLVNLIVK